MDKTLTQKLEALLGAEHVVTDPLEREYFSQDVYAQSDFTAQAVIAPDNLEQLSAAVRMVTQAGYSLFPRGGGLSYTGGYLPTTDKSVSLDTSRMNRVLEINRRDMYVRVEAGCTWADLHKALKGTKLRTPFWGTLSGLSATVGGSMSQNSIFFGSGLYGTSADTVVGMKVVAADGRVVNTGSAANYGSPFFRHYGPDLTGIFTGDCGALGIKAEITLRLIKAPKFKEHASFSFEKYEDMLSVMSKISRNGLASECFGFDPFLQAQRMKRESLTKDIKSLAGVMKSSGSVMGALKKGAKIAAAGRGFMKDVPYSLHITSENRHAAAARADIADIKDIAHKGSGTEIENAIPTLIAANPFMPPNSMIGPSGERWAPVHAVIPHSQAVDLMTAMEELFAEHSDKITQYEIGIGYLLTSVGASAIVLEPVFFWQDVLKEFHKRNVEAGHLKKINGFEENLEIRAFVGELRDALKKLCLEHKAIHFQIGKTYLYKEGLSEVSFALVKAIKHHMDPEDRLNPGALGLG
jgi:FAD/FMN-containing dehydrogenase